MVLQLPVGVSTPVYPRLLNHLDYFNDVSGQSGGLDEEDEAMKTIDAGALWIIVCVLSYGTFTAFGYNLRKELSVARTTVKIATEQRKAMRAEAYELRQEAIRMRLTVASSLNRLNALNQQLTSLLRISPEAMTHYEAIRLRYPIYEEVAPWADEGY